MTLLGAKRKLDFGSKKKAKSRRTQVGRSVFRKPRNMRPKLGAGSTYRYSRWASSGQTMELTGPTFSGNNIFSLDDVKGYTDFTALYDQFMISHCQIHVTLISNPNAPAKNNATIGVGTDWNSNNWYPKMWYVYDSDDSNTLSLDTIRERQGVKYKTLEPNKTMVINVKPRLLVQTYRTATSTGYAPKRMFIDVATGYNVPHYGIKFVLDTMGIDPIDKFMVRFETKYWLKFKGVL